jgi:MYXO-CTERM domain-containing protein
MSQSPLAWYSSLVAALTLLSGVLVGLGYGPQSAGAESHPEENSACSAILAAWGSDLNTTFFMRACSEASFQAAFDRWGLENFSIGSGDGPGWTDEYYVFDWVGACTNASIAEFGPRCSIQEYWTVNLTTDQLSGPTIQEGPLICSCGPQSAQASSRVLPILVVSAAVGAVAAGAPLALRHRRRRGRQPPPSSTPMA